MLRTSLIILVGVALLAACGNVGPTGDTNRDPEAAQNYLPNVSGFSTTDADSIADAIATAGGGAALASGNPVLAGAIAKLDDMIQCYQDVGAVAARIYTQVDIASLAQGSIPSIGVVAVINQDRLANNFLACALGQRSSAQAQAQSAGIEPCSGSGDFTINGEHLSYLYAAIEPGLCATFDLHFQNVRQNQGG